MLLLLAMLGNIVLLTSCSAFEKSPYEKLVYLREILMNKEEFEQKMESFDNEIEKDRWIFEYAETIEELLFDLGIGTYISVFDENVVTKANAKLKLTKSDIEKYIEEYSFADLMELSMDLRTTVANELDGYKSNSGEEIYMPTIYNIIVEWCIQLRPNEFIQLKELNENSTSGFYAEHKNAEPIAKEEPVQGTSKVNTTTVTYYGDFAIKNSTEYEFDDGFLGWEDGNFIDRPGYNYTETFKSLYYKGAHVTLFYSNNGHGLITDDSDYFYIYIPENKNYINYVIKSDQGMLWFQYSYYND